MRCAKRIEKQCEIQNAKCKMGISFYRSAEMRGFLGYIEIKTFSTYLSIYDFATYGIHTHTHTQEAFRL